VGRSAVSVVSTSAESPAMSASAVLAATTAVAADSIVVP
jgi:hypothetical protein